MKPVSTYEMIKDFSIVSFLAQCGFSPVRLNNNEAWYLSPLRKEKTASFHVSIPMNLWYDHGIGKGGGILQLIALIKGCSIRESIKHINLDQMSADIEVSARRSSPKKVLQVTQIESDFNKSLLKYAGSRNIGAHLLKKFCKQVSYRCRGNTYVAIGLYNQAGGWELRSPYFKGTSSPKSYSWISKKGRYLIVVEGLFDFLSLSALGGDLLNLYDIVVLNSVVQVKKISFLLKEFTKVLAFLDNDAAGKAALKELKQNNIPVLDCSSLYAPCKDLNEAHMKSIKMDFHKVLKIS